MATAPKRPTATDIINDMEQRPVFYGLVRALDDKDDETFQFARGSNCGKWLTLRMSQVHEIRMLSVARCGDHEHPFVMLVLAPPKTEEAKLLARLAVESTVSVAPRPGPGGGGGGICFDAATGRTFPC